MTSSTPSPRWHELDAVRAFALLLGVALHGAMSFIAPRIWLVDDTQHSTGLAVAFYVIHMFRMTIFFVLAGFFARMLLQKRGVGGFIANRLKRVALPLAAFWPVIFPAIIAVAIFANMPAPGAPAVPAPPPPALSAATFPFTHLWFLYVLLLLYGCALVVKLVTDVLHVGGALGRAMDTVFRLVVRSDFAPLVFGLPVALAFYFSDTWMMWFGIMSPDTGLMPNIVASVGFKAAFIFGWWLNRSSDLLEHLASRVWAYLPAAVIGTVACIAIVGAAPATAPVAGHDHPIYAGLYALTSWTWVLALIGLARLLLTRENPVIRYLSDASYWVYIVHLPLVLVLQNAVKAIDAPAEAKFVLVVAGTVGVALLSYQLLVRYTFIGTILNGRRQKAKAMRIQEATA
ncbi:acyltransferase family protein [Asticcacaulis solisilvae]|uniref:acyltransferase family protein n=1 Tax=Asticcacaulis solisilvae TaxID=1217274 RepID=UPI003FD8C7BC